MYRKELFLQANFRFLVADWADLRGAASDPDHMVDWDDVVLVEMASATPLSCPVCLDEPMTCAQVTLCGHAFCFPCIARHAATVRKEGEPAKCPMCFTPLRLADLRTVRRRPIDPIGGEGLFAGGGMENNDGNARKPAAARKGVAKNARLTLLSRRRDSAVPTPVRVAGRPGVNEHAGARWPRSSHDADGGRCDLFAKYTLTADEALLGEEESGALEQRVAFMAAEGGAEAEQELPYALLACDVMQSRLEAWAVKRAGAANLPPPPRGPSRKDAAAKTAERAAERAARERSMDGAFPALPGSHPGLAGDGGSRRPPGMTAADWHDHSVAFLMGKAVEAASAFTDEEVRLATGRFDRVSLVGLEVDHVVCEGKTAYKVPEQHPEFPEQFLLTSTLMLEGEEPILRVVRINPGESDQFDALNEQRMEKLREVKSALRNDMAQLDKLVVAEEVSR